MDQVLGCARLRSVLWFFSSSGDSGLFKISGRMIPLVLGVMMLLKIQLLVSEALLKGLSVS